MRILVIGGCGFLGCNFIRYVLGHYHAEFITNVDAMRYPGNLQNLDGVAETFFPRYECIEADACDSEELKRILALHKYFAVVHFASEATSELCRSLPDAVSKFRVKRVLQISQPGFEPHNTAFFDAALKADVHAVVLKASGVYGPNDWALAPMPTKIRTILEAVSRNDGIAPIAGDSGQDQDWLHVDDFSSAIMAAVLEGARDAILSPGPDHAIPDSVLSDWIYHSITRTPLPPASQPPTLPLAGIDSSLIRQELDWRPIIKPLDGIRDVVDWYLYYRARLVP